MTKTQNKTENVSDSNEVKRGKGRPKTFPGRETVALSPVQIPIEVRGVRNEPINLTIARFIENGHKAAMRSRTKKN